MNAQDLITQARQKAAAGHWAQVDLLYREAVDNHPSDIKLWLRFGALYFEAERLESAYRVYERATRKAPDCYDAWHNFGAVNLLMGDLFSGRLALREAARLDPSKLPNVEQVVRSVASLPAALADRQQWNGEPLEGRSIVLYANQGNGDTIEWVRHLPRLRRLGAQVCLACQPPLVNLLAEQILADLVLNREGQLPESDYVLPLSALPYQISKVEDFQPHDGLPYMKPNPDSLQHLSGLLRIRPGFKVGLVWSGNPQNPRDGKRSMPFEMLTPLLEKKAFHCLALQYPLTAPEAALENPRCHLPPCDDRSFENEAALIKALDVLVTVDTATAHLGGALGQRTAVLLSDQPDPRWQRGDSETPLYQSARLFRRAKGEDWLAVTTRLANELEALAAG